MSAPATPRYDSLVRVNLPLLTLSVGAATIEGLWSEEVPLTVRQWRSKKLMAVNWRTAVPPRPVDWRKET